MRSKTGLTLRRLGPLLLCPTPRGPPPLPPRFVPTWAYLEAAHWVTWFPPRTNLPGGEGIGALVSANYQRRRLSGDPRGTEETQQSPWNETALKISPVSSGLHLSNEKGSPLERCGSDGPVSIRESDTVRRLRCRRKLKERTVLSHERPYLVR